MDARNWKERIYSAGVGRGDWCISRQRSWGLQYLFFTKEWKKCR